MAFWVASGREKPFFGFFKQRGSEFFFYSIVWLAKKVKLVEGGRVCMLFFNCTKVYVRTAEILSTGGQNILS
jgi:hypothetical protein